MSIGYLFAAVFLILWGRSYRHIAKVAKKIRERMPPSGEQRIPILKQDVVAAASSPFELISACYGSERKKVDVSKQLRGMIREGKLRVKASNKIAGDPHKGVRKWLTIDYRSYGIVDRAIVKEGQAVSLPD